MAELTAEQLMMQNQEYARREDVTEERQFWRDILFSTFPEEQKITGQRLEEAIAIADRALEEFRRRFQ